MASRKNQLPEVDRLSPVVVKIGGSLLHQGAEIVSVVRSSHRPLLIVPGGGTFADMVRHSAVNDDAAHWMAIAAMDQYGWMLASWGIGTTDLLEIPGRPCVLLPYRVMRERDPLPHSWDVTSDTIAAWVASMLGTDLLLLKSVDGITRRGVLLPMVSKPVVSDVVDPCFIRFVLKNRVRAYLINGMNTERVKRWLEGEMVPGTVIGTTF
jgi:hypothetical protein